MSQDGGGWGEGEVRLKGFPGKARSIFWIQECGWEKLGGKPNDKAEEGTRGQLTKDIEGNIWNFGLYPEGDRS